MSARATLVPADEHEDVLLRPRFGISKDQLAPRPRILHICTRYSRGGSEQRLRDIVAATPEYEHHIIVGHDSDLDLLSSQLPEVHVHHEASLHRALDPRRDVVALRHLRQTLSHGGYEAIVTHQSKAGVLGRVAARTAGGTPVVHSLSMADFGPGYGPIEDRLFRLLERHLERWTAAYVVVGGDLADRFARIGVPESKLTIVRSGVKLPEPSGGRAEVRARVAGVCGLPEDRPWILYVGSLDERKNVLALPILLQQAIQLSVGKRPYLVLAGIGPAQEQLSSMLSQMGLDEDSRLLGYVENPGDLFAAAEAVVLMSRAEGLPQVLVQAAAVGTPFVATSIDGADELLELGASGTVVDHDDVVGAARALLPYLRWPVESCEPRIDLASWRSDMVQALHGEVLRSVLSHRGHGGATPSTELKPNGAVVALIGSDGSGKSTVSHALVEAFASRQEVLHLYLGSGDGPSSILRWPLKRIRRLVFGTKGTTVRKDAVDQRAPRALGMSKAIWALTLAHEKQSKLRRARRAADHGVLVICDRFPQTQVPGTTDGPLLDAWTTSPSRWRRALGRWEARPYQEADRNQPDLVVRLRVDQSTAEQRRPDHLPFELNSRRLIVEKLNFDGSARAVAEVDANRPLGEVLEAAVAAIADCVEPAAESLGDAR